MQNDSASTSPLEGLPIWVNDANEVWPTLRIARSIPLSRLEWLWNSRGTSLKESSTTARAVFEVSTVRTPTFQAPIRDSHDWFRNPYVYALVTTVQDLDFSKEASWSRIRRFVDDCKEMLYEYLIVLAATDEELVQQKRIIDKLRADVNLAARGRERLVVVPPAAIREEQRPITHLHHSPSHQQMLVRLRECVREGAEARVQAYEEEVSRSYLNRSSTSWAFTKFFALKEGMAFVFVQLGRRDLAVRLYDELQATMTERNERGCGVFCDEQAADAAAGVTRPDGRDYRACLLDNSITEIDLRTYLFARQISLLLSDRKFSDVAERGLKLITALARRCAEETQNEGKSISAVFRDIWVFSTARALAAALTPAIPSPKEADTVLSAQLGTPRERHTARLIAGFHVHALKAFLGLAHVTLPGCLAPEDPLDTRDKTDIAEEARGTSNEKLRHALSNRKKAEVLHGEIANAAASLYEMGGRARGAAALDGDAGVVRLRNGSFSEAETLLSAQCSRFTNDNGWDDLHKRQRLELARAEKELDRVQEYLVSCLTMLYMSRSARRLWRRHLSSDDDEQTAASEATHWAAEAASASTRLPRIMKYKADRLFEVSVLPNEELWIEGDPGTAVVRIRSDIPTTIKLDSVMMECRNTCAPARIQKSALHPREGQRTPATRSEGCLTPSANSSNPTSPTSPTPSPAATADAADMVVFRSKTSVELKDGLNNIHVNVSEVPHSGRYNVTLVAMFMGNLKLVQAASKASATPIVTTKGSTSNRNSSLSASPSILSDFAKGEVKFPMFYTSPRSPSAVVTVEEQNTLYLAPLSVQFVHVKIKSGPHGIRKGSTLTCSLIASNSTPLTNVTRFVTLVDTASEDLPEGSQGAPIVLKLRPVLEDGEAYFDNGEAVLDEQLGDGQELEARIAVRLLEECNQFQDRSVDDKSEDRSCTLQLQLSCFEKDSETGRRFVCSTERKLLFSSPVEVSARIELSSEWGDDYVSRAVGLDGVPLGDGGTLVCALQKKSNDKHPVTIMKAALETPEWLELRPDEAPAHMELLPFTLGNRGSFTCAFDILTREEIVNERQYVMGEREGVDSVFDKDAAERRLSRAIANSADMGESQEDMSGWGRERRQEAPPAPNNENIVSTGRPFDVPAGQANIVYVENEGSAAERATEAGDGSEPIDVGISSGAETLPTEEIHLDGHIDMEPVEEEDPMHVKEAEEVVDLSAPGHESNPPSLGGFSSSAVAAGSNSLATLRVDMKIEGLGFVACIERKICMNALRKVRRRFRVERSMKRIGESGKLMELQFAVRTMGNGRSEGLAAGAGYDETSDTEFLHYEVDADPIVWLIVGRRRGKLNMITGLATVGSAKMIPLVCGRQRVPCIRLFTHDGRGLAFSRYENVNEYMQVVVVPCRTVVSACSSRLSTDVSEEGGNASPQGTVAGKTKMPEVIASDSFFGK